MYAQRTCVQSGRLSIENIRNTAPFGAELVRVMHVSHVAAAIVGVEHVALERVVHVALDVVDVGHTEQQR